MSAGARVRALVGALVLAGLAGLTAPTADLAAAAPEPPETAQLASVQLVSQTPTVPRRGTFEITVRTDGIPADASLELVLHGRVRSRSELAASMEGEALRTQVYRASTPLAALPVDAEGGRRLSISLDPTVTGGIAVSASGAYPVEVRALTVDGAEIATLVTHLLVEPDARDESPPLAVAVVAGIDAPPAIGSDGTTTRLDLDLDGAAELLATLAAHEDVPATLAVRPETLDELASRGRPEHVALLDALPAAASGRSVLALPYVDVSPDALAQAGLAEELDEQLEHGRDLLADGSTRSTSASDVARR